MTNRYKRAGIIRAAVQIASFIVLPGLFVEALSGVGALVTAIATGTYPASLASQVVAAVVTIVATMLVGRVFCGWVCSFGAMGDLLGAIGRKAKIQVKVPDGADKGLKLVKYAVLALVVLCWLGIVSVSESWSPCSVMRPTALSCFARSYSRSARAAEAWAWRRAAWNSRPSSLASTWPRRTGTHSVTKTFSTVPG